MSRGSASFRLPTVSHVLSSPAEEQVRADSVVLVANIDNSTAVETVSEIQRYAWFWEDGDHVAIDTEPAYTAVWMHTKHDVREGLAP